MTARDPSEQVKQGSVNLTIVGARPTEDESGSRGTPRGLEVLLKKASVDAEFRTLLLEDRSRAAESITLELDPAEAAMLDHMPAEQLGAIVRQIRVREEDRRIFLGKVASVMLAALGAGVSGCVKKSFGVRPDETKGIRPDRVEKAASAAASAPAETGAPDPNRASGAPQEQGPGTAPVAEPAPEPQPPESRPSWQAGVLRGIRPD